MGISVCERLHKIMIKETDVHLKPRMSQPIRNVSKISFFRTVSFLQFSVPIIVFPGTESDRMDLHGELYVHIYIYIYMYMYSKDYITILSSFLVTCTRRGT